MSNESILDIPKLLRAEQPIENRRKQLGESHIASLSKLVERWRKNEQGKDIPDFDPWDGGINAEILYLLEAPGPKASCKSGSGFVSRNNPDETAKNFFELNNEASIPRDRTICWNIVPWYIGSETKIRPANRKDIDSGLERLFELLELLPKLRGIILLGRKAQRASEKIITHKNNLKIFMAPHPSPSFINRAPGNRDSILTVLNQVATFLGNISRGTQ